MPLSHVSPRLADSPRLASAALHLSSRPVEGQYSRVGAAAQQAFPPSLERSTTKRGWKIILYPFVSVVALIYLVFVIVIGGPIRLYERFDQETSDLTAKIDVMRTKVMQGQLDAMQRIAKPGTFESSAKHYKEKLSAFQRLVSADVPKGKMQKRVNEIRNKLRSLMQHPEYKKHFKSARADIVYLQNLALALKTGGTSGKALTEVGTFLQEKYGRGLLDDSESFSFSEFAEHLDSIYDLIPTVHKDTWCKKLGWWFAHPLKTVESLVGEGHLSFLGYHPEGYNSCEHGNFEQMAGTFVHDDKRLTFFHGPGFGQDREIDCAALQAQRRLGGSHWQHTLENTHRKGERPRLDAQRRISEEFSGTMTLSSSQFDGPAEKGFGLGEGGTEFTSAAYYDELAEHIGITEVSEGAGAGVGAGEGAAPYHTMSPLGEEDSGFTFPRAMSKEDIQGAHTHSRELMGAVTSENSHWATLDPHRRARVCLVTFEVFAKLKTMLKLMDAQPLLEAERRDLQEQALHTSSEACKQDIDRAIVINVMTQVCLARLRGDPITREQEDFLTGMTFARAVMVDSRVIIHRRYVAIPDFLRVFDGHEEALKGALRDYLGEDPELLQFKIAGSANSE